MTYLMSWERDTHTAKLESIQESNFVLDLLDEDEEEDFFGFAKAIQIDHLTNEQVDEIFDMLGDI